MGLFCTSKTNLLNEKYKFCSSDFSDWEGEVFDDINLLTQQIQLPNDDVYFSKEYLQTIQRNHPSIKYYYYLVRYKKATVGVGFLQLLDIEIKDVSKWISELTQSKFIFKNLVGRVIKESRVQ